MSVDRGSSSIAWTIQKTAIASVAIVVTLCSPITAQPLSTQTLSTDWLNFRSTASVGQLAVFNSDPVATLQGATFTAKDRTGALITQGTFTPPIPPGFVGNTAFTLSGSGAVITINVPSTFDSCNLHPSLVVTPSSATAPFPVDQFPSTTFERFSIGGPIQCPQFGEGHHHRKRGSSVVALTPGIVFAGANTSQSFFDVFFDLHNPTQVPQTYTFGVYNPDTGQADISQQTTVGPDQVVRQPVTFSGFRIPVVCGDGSVVSPTLTVQQTFAFGGQTHTELLPFPAAQHEVTVTVRNPTGISSSPTTVCAQ